MSREVASTRACGLICWATNTCARAQHRVEVQALEVTGELLDAVDLALALDLDRHGPRSASLQSRSTGPMSVGIASHEAQALGDGRAVGGEQLLEVGLDAVLLQTRVDAEVVGRVGEHLPRG